MMSRSVTTPIGAWDVLTTGISPQSLSTIICATSTRPVSGKQLATFLDMMSRTFITHLQMTPGARSVPVGRWERDGKELLVSDAASALQGQPAALQVVAV